MGGNIMEQLNKSQQSLVPKKQINQQVIFSRDQLINLKKKLKEIYDQQKEKGQSL